MNLKSMLTTNIQMKLLSLLLSVLIWLFVALESNDEVEIPVSVSYLNTPSGLVVKTKQDSGLLLRVEGQRILLLRQKLVGASVRLDLAGAREGSVVLSGIESSVKLIQGVKPVPRLPLKAELTLVLQR